MPVARQAEQSDPPDSPRVTCLREHTDQLAQQWCEAVGVALDEPPDPKRDDARTAVRFLSTLWACLEDPSSGQQLQLLAAHCRECLRGLDDPTRVLATLRCLKRVLREHAARHFRAHAESLAADLQLVEELIDRQLPMALCGAGDASGWTWEHAAEADVALGEAYAALTRAQAPGPTPRRPSATQQLLFELPPDVRSSPAEGASGRRTRPERRLTALHELAGLTVAGKSTQAILESSVDIVARALEAEFAHIFLYDEPAQCVRLGAYSGLPEPLRSRIAVQDLAPDEPGIAARTARTGEPVVVQDVRTDPLTQYARDEAMAAGGGSMLSVPAVGNHGLVAVLQVSWRATHSLTDEDVALLSTVARQLALVVERSRADEEQERQARHLECLHAIGRAASESIELEEVLQSALETAVATLPADGGLIALLEPETDQIVRAVHTGVPAAALVLTHRIVLGSGLTGRVVQSGVAEAVNDVVRDAALVVPGAAEAGARAMVSAPLRGREGILGAITLVARKKDAFQREIVHLLEAIGAQLGVAIENARLYREARAAEQHLKNIVTATPHAITVTDRDLRLSEFNEAAEHLFGLRRPEDLGVHLFDLWPPDDRLEVTRIARAVLAGEAVEEFRTEIASGAGARTPCRVALSALRDEAGDIIGCVAVSTDLRKQRELEEQLVKAERLHALGEMASGVAHDFNNVLAGILGRTQLLLRRADDEKFAGELRTIEQIALDGAETVRRIQEFTDVRPARQFVKVTPIALVRDAIAMTRHRWSDRIAETGAQIRMETDLAETPPVAGNPAELREVLVNLVLNAVDALVEGGTIRLATSCADNHVCIAIADDGAGMTRETALRVFEPFFTTKGVAGTGLGLSVSYGIVLRHGGDITVESAPGQGATFTVRLPVASASVAERPEEPQARGARILVIDDEKLVREALTDMLDVLGHRTRSAAGGEEGLMAFSEGQYDMVITDLGMPDISGWEVAAAIKQKSPETFVALLTGWGTQMDPDRLADGAVDLLLGKPVTAVQLEKAIDKALAAKASPS